MLGRAAERKEMPLWQKLCHVRRELPGTEWPQAPTDQERKEKKFQ